MKTYPALLLAWALTLPTFAPAAADAPTPATGADAPAGPWIPASSAVLTAPLVLKDGAIGQSRRSELADGGRAVFAFTVPEAGDYTVRAVVDAPAGDANSFYVNIDAPPEDPGMIWDIAGTKGFEERIVGWRGRGDANYSEFAPKVFQLGAGKHQLIIVGREPARLKSVSIHSHPAAPAPTPGSLAFLQKQYAEAEAAYNLAMCQLTDTPEGRAKANELWRKLDAEHAGQFMAAVQIAEANPRSGTGFGALAWVLKLENVRSYHLPAGPRALALLHEQYARDPQIGGTLAPLIRYFPYPRDAFYQVAVDLLNAVLTGNPDRTARGHAALGLALLAKRKFQEAEWRGEPVALARVSEEIVQAFEAVVRNYGDCRDLAAGGLASATATLGDRAARELQEIRHLGIGQVAPEITGSDLDGAPMKLSESRGKVVLLVFWAAWCGPCMAAVPHEKQLVERFKGRPFVLLGVNGDDDVKAAAKAVTKNQIPWRSFWNGPEGPGGPIATAWNVRGWPTVYVLDQHGVIRQKYLWGKDLDEPLEKLVAAVEPAG